jgi:hypothetical protein
MSHPPLVLLAPLLLVPTSAQVFTYRHKLQLTPALSLSWTASDAALDVKATWTQPLSYTPRWVGVAFSRSSNMNPGDGFAVQPGFPDPREGFTSRVLINGYSFCATSADLPACVPDLDFSDEATTILPPFFNFTAYADKWVMEGGLRRSLRMKNTSATAELVPGTPSTSFLLTDVGAADLVDLKDIYVNWAWGFEGVGAMGSHTSEMSGSARVNLVSGTFVQNYELGPIIAHVASSILAFLVLLPALWTHTWSGPSAAQKGLRNSVRSHATALLLGSPLIVFQRGFVLLAIISFLSSFAVDVASIPAVPHFSTPHSKAGIASLVLALLVSEPVHYSLAAAYGSVSRLLGVPSLANSSFYFIVCSSLALIASLIATFLAIYETASPYYSSLVVGLWCAAASVLAMAAGLCTFRWCV